MNLEDFGFSVTESEKKHEFSHETRGEVRCARSGEFIAWFSATVRTSSGLQVLNTSSQFVQRNHLSKAQIDALTDWLRERTMAARWRLTTYTVLVA